MKPVPDISSNRSIAFFEEQFRRQPGKAAPKLNPFEEMALPYLNGDVLDFGCGLGNLAFAAAGRGCRVTALDAGPAAVKHVQACAAAERATVTASLAGLRDYALTGDHDCIVCIGLLTFFDCPTASRALSQLQARVRPGGVAVVNVLVEGATYLDIFNPGAYCLYRPSAVEERFAGWTIERSEIADFAAPSRTLTRFCTVIARKRGGAVAGRPCPRS